MAIIPAGIKIMIDRPVTLRLVTLACASFTNWNLVYQMMFSLVTAFLTFLVLSRQIANSFKTLELGKHGPANILFCCNTVQSGPV